MSSFMQTLFGLASPSVPAFQCKRTTKIATSISSKTNLVKVPSSWEASSTETNEQSPLAPKMYSEVSGHRGSVIWNKSCVLLLRLGNRDRAFFLVWPCCANACWCSRPLLSNSLSCARSPLVVAFFTFPLKGCYCCLSHVVLAEWMGIHVSSRAWRCHAGTNRAKAESRRRSSESEALTRRNVGRAMV